MTDVDLVRPPMVRYFNSSFNLGAGPRWIRPMAQVIEQTETERCDCEEAASWPDPHPNNDLDDPAIEF